jgi:hypothetical protein
MPYQAPGYAPFMKHVDIPSLVANGGLENTSGVAQTLPSTGFAASDVLQLFRVPAGFWLMGVGVRPTTAEGAACTADIGNASATQTHLLEIDADGYMGTIDLNGTVVQICLVGDAHLGFDNNMAVLFVTDGTIDMTFGSADTETCIFDTWAIGFKVW